MDSNIQQASYPAAAERHLSLDLFHSIAQRKVYGQLSAVFTEWGYESLVIPLIDQYNPYRRHLQNRIEKRANRIIGNHGTMLLVRPDLTLFFARRVANSIDVQHMPLRLCYGGSIIKNILNADTVSYEWFHSGAEYVGARSIDADIEILLMALDALSVVGIVDTTACVGSRALLDIFIKKLSPETVQHVKQCIVSCNHLDLPSAWRAGGYSIEQSRALTALFIGDEPFAVRVGTVVAAFDNSWDDTLAARIALSNVDERHDGVKSMRDGRETAARNSTQNGLTVHALCTALDDTIAYLQRIVDGIAECNSSNVQIDLSNIGSNDYYTGYAFSIYYRHANDKIAAGGRYDELFGSFGVDVPAAGMTIFQEHIIESVKSKIDDELGDNKYGAVDDGHGFAHKYREIQRKRSQQQHRS